MSTPLGGGAGSWPATALRRDRREYIGSDGQCRKESQDCDGHQSMNVHMTPPLSILPCHAAVGSLLHPDVLLENRRILDCGLRGGQFQRLLEGSGGLSMFPRLVECEGQVIVGFGKVRIGLDGFLEPFYRDIPVALLIVADS